MKRLVIAAAALAAGLFATGRTPAADVMDKTAFGELLAKMQAAAATAKPDPNDPLLHSLRSQAYGEDSVEPLRTALATLPATDAGIYVAGRIMVPLLSSETAVVRKAGPAVVAAHGRLVKYQAVPVLSQAELKAMELARDPDPRAENRLRLLTEFMERRQKRMESEARIYRTNVQSMVLEKVAWGVLLRTAHPTDDDRVLGAVVKAEQDKIATYKLPLEAIVAHASQVEEGRAARLYGALVKHGKALEWVEGNYLDPSRIRFGVNESSGMVLVHCYPGVDILTAANALAATAKRPAVSVPTAADITANSMLNVAKGRIAAGRRVTDSDVRSVLDAIIRRYGDTKAAVEARQIQKAGRP